ncbi:MAG: acyl-CoA dehydratase activase-related protein [Halanaerobiaceae bacterium]
MIPRIGIPGALMYHYYFPLWEKFFEELNLDVVLSPETNKKIMNQGIKLAVDDICLPFKAYYGHVLEIKDRVDYLFIPRFVSLGKHDYMCPKFMGLPDMIKANIDDLPEIIDPTIDLRKGIMPLRKIAYNIGKIFNKNIFSIEKAYRKSIKKHKQYKEMLKEDIYSVDNIKKTVNKKIKFGKNGTINIFNNKVSRTNDKNKQNNVGKKFIIGILGHSYILNDRFMSMNLIEHLNKMGVDVLTTEMFDNELLERYAAKQSKRSFWYFNRKVMGTAYNLLTEQNIDGIIQVTAFGCGPDSMIKELIDLKYKKSNISVLNINLDEHSGEAGLLTRLEAFIDLLERRKMA